MLSDGRLRGASIVAALIFVVDQVTKSVVQHTMVTNESIPLTSFLALTYVRNPGAAFGLLAGVPGAVRLPLLLAVTGAAVWVLVAFLRDAPAERRGLVAAIGGVLGGAAGNLVCRVRYGEVVDFIHLHWRGFDWPMFNVADSAISVGVGVILLYSLRSPAGAPAPR
jgi:signal peptidase II